MSNQELDNLFKNKLEDFQKKPSRDLWNDINQQLVSSKKKPAIWLWSVAASILLLFSVGVWFYAQLEPQQDILLATNEVPNKDQLIKESVETHAITQKEVKNSSEESLDVQPLDNSISENKNEHKVDAVKPSTVKVKKSIIKDEVTTSVSKEPTKLDSEIREKETPVILETDISENIAKNEMPEATITNSPASNTQQGKTLVFDISQFKKEPAMASVSEEEKKDTKLKKLIKLAKDIKQGESGLSELRTAKNDLFAFNSRKEDNGR